METVLVTGATGFVGSHLTEKLIRSGVNVRCLVRDPGRLRWLSGLNVSTVTGDCTESRVLDRAVEGTSIVYHLAGLTKARYAREYYEVNHQGTANLLRACERSAPALRKFVLVSSLAAAGPGREGQPKTEHAEPAPVSDYGRSKLLAEQETLRFRDRFPVVILRPSAVYGPRDRDMFELFLWAKRGLTLEIAGGERFLNPCFVGDLVEAVLLAGSRDVASGSIYHIAEDHAYSWRAFREILLRTGTLQARNIVVPYWFVFLLGLLSELGGRLTGKAALTNRQKVREAAQRYWTCDVGRAKSDLGFTAGHSLEQGLRITWEWYRQQQWL